MDDAPTDLDRTRAAIADRGLVPAAVGHLTAEVATAIPFESLAAFKDLLKRYFSPLPWSEREAASLSDLVMPHLEHGWWDHDLGHGIRLSHGIRDGRYRLLVTGGAEPSPSIFDKVFDGPVRPEATPHPRKVKFTFGGAPRHGEWYRRGDPDPPRDERVRRLLGEPDVTDVMVAGDFVTIGLSNRSSWERRLEPLRALVAELFAAGAAATEPATTREQMIREAGRARTDAGPDALHLLDPDDPRHRRRLTAALEDEDARVRRTAVAILSEASDVGIRTQAIERGYADRSPIVRRTAVDAAGDVEEEALRPFLETSLQDDDAWIRWRAARALGALGAGPSKPALEARSNDPEFRVRFEVERILREERG